MNISVWFLLSIMYCLSNARLEDIGDYFDSVPNANRWAFLAAGSDTYDDYRHQVLIDNGVLPDHIIVFMEDNIAFNESNPFPGRIYNTLRTRRLPPYYGRDVYQGVNKDYTGDNVTMHNIYNAFVADGNNGVTGGSGKDLATSDEDYIFFFFSGHGNGLGLFVKGYFLSQASFIGMIEKKREKSDFRRMLVYIESCMSGGMIKDLPKDLDVYATAAARSRESSYSGGDNAIYNTFGTNIEDRYSVAWMEDCETNDLNTRTVGQQFDKVKQFVQSYRSVNRSVVVENGYKAIKKDTLSLYMGSGRSKRQSIERNDQPSDNEESVGTCGDDMTIWILKSKIRRADEGSLERAHAEQELDELISHNKHIDQSINAIRHGLAATVGELSLHSSKWDWKCINTLISIYQEHCGTLKTYGTKHFEIFANLCHLQIKHHIMASASA